MNQNNTAIRRHTKDKAFGISEDTAKGTLTRVHKGVARQHPFPMIYGRVVTV